jgi:hypothetical protein
MQDAVDWIITNREISLDRPGLVVVHRQVAPVGAGAQ